MEFQFNFTILAIDELFDDEIHPMALKRVSRKVLAFLGQRAFRSSSASEETGASVTSGSSFGAGPSGVSGTVSSCSSKESGAAAFSASFTVTRTLRPA
mgnify:CR=1 FL=1